MTKSVVAAVWIGLIALPGLPAAKVQKEADKKERTEAAAKKQDRPAREMKQTPFGPVEAKPEEPRPQRKLSDDGLVSAERQGDMVVFRRKTPFGDQVWKKKESELSDDEKELLARPSGEKPAESSHAAAKVESSPQAKDKPKP